MRPLEITEPPEEIPQRANMNIFGNLTGAPTIPITRFLGMVVDASDRSRDRAPATLADMTSWGWFDPEASA